MPLPLSGPRGPARYLLDLPGSRLEQEGLQGTRNMHLAWLLPDSHVT